MKKLLALVLALVMTLGLATVSSSAAYSDKADINYNEAVDVMTAVGVFQGKGSNFDPKANLNRAEAAKIVAYLMLGNDAAESIKGTGSKFTDVPADHWASGYIEYLASAGVLSGVGGGKFDPNGQVTATQFAKMLLVALGYDATLEGFVGESWSINIAKLANDNDLFDGLDILGSAALTREQAAQMCLNDLKADTVDYESKGTTISLSDGVKATVDAKKSEAKTTTATKGNAIDGDDARGTTADPYTLQLGEDLYNGDLKLESTRDDFGRPASKWTYKNVEIDTYVDKSDLKAEYTAEIKRGPMYDLLGSSVYDHLVLGSGAKEYATLSYYEDGVGGVVNGSATAATNKTAVEKYVLKNGDKGINYDAANDKASTGNGTLTQVFVDSDDNVTITVTNTYIFQASSDYRTSSEDLVVAQPSGATAIALDSTRLELEDFPEIKDLKKDDYILVTAHRANAGAVYSVDSIAKAELLTATVDKYVGKDSVTLNGETKKYSKMTDTTSKDTDYSVGQETTVVLDKYGYIIYVDEAVVANNYVFVSELYQANGSTTSSVKANAYFTDGTSAEITVKEISGVNKTKNELATDAAAGAANKAGVVAGDEYVGWYTYNKNSSGEYTLNALSGSEKEYASYAGGAGAMSLTKSDAVKFISGGTAFAANNFYQVKTSTATDPKADDKTIVVVTYAENNDVDVYTGVKNIPEINLTDATGKANIFSVVNGSNYAKYVFVTLEGNYTVFGTESENLLYIIERDKKNVISTDTTYYTYKALDENAKEIKVEADGSAIFGTNYTAYYKTSKNTDGRYTRGQEVPNSTSGTAKYLNLTGKKDTIDANNGTLSIAGDNFTLANGYKLVVVSKVDALNKLIKNNTGYEANIMTAEGLEAMVQGYSVTYNVQAKLDDTYTTGRGGKLLEAYVTITAATPTNAAVTPAVVRASDLPAVSYAAGTISIPYYYSDGEPNAAETKAIIAEFVDESVPTYSMNTQKATTASGVVYDVKFVPYVKVSVGSDMIGYAKIKSDTKAVDGAQDLTYPTAGKYGLTVGANAVTAVNDGTRLVTVTAAETFTVADAIATAGKDLVYMPFYQLTAGSNKLASAKLTSAVTVNNTTGAANATITLGTSYVISGAVVTLTSSNNTADAYRKFVNKTTNTDIDTYGNVVSNGSAKTYTTYTVTADATIDATDEMYHVTIVNGTGTTIKDLGYIAAEGASAENFDVDVADATFAVYNSTKDGKYDALATTVINFAGLKAGVKTLKAADAVAGNVALTQVVAVTTTLASTYDFGTATGKTFASGKYYAVGAKIYVVAGTNDYVLKYQLTGMGSAAAVPTAANDAAALGITAYQTPSGDKASLTYTVPSAHLTMAFTEAAS